MKINYNPIKQLKIFTETKLGKNYAVNNEIDAIRLMVENLSNTAIELNTKISNSKVAIKDFLLSSLIKGDLVDIKEFNNKAQDINICFKYDMLYYVSIFLIESANNEDYCNRIECNKLIELLEKSLPYDMQGYGISGIDKDKIIFIAASHHKNKRTIKDAIIQLQQNLRDFYGIYTFIGVGGIYTSINQVGKSYIEANIAADYRFIKGKGKILFFNEVNFPSSDITDYPLKEINILKTSIINGDIDKTTQALSDLLSVIKDTNISITTARCLCYDVINTIIKSVYIVSKEYITLQNKIFDLSSVLKFKTVEELCETLRETSYEICSNINSYRNKDVHNFIDNIISYIKNSYCNYNFSVQNMANHFRISLPNLSHYFKQETGQTISDYVNYLRIEKAKELLISKDDTLQIIVEEIGYCDTSSFVRKFRKAVGMTPGEYRKVKFRTS